MGPADRLGRHWENKHLRNVNARLLKAGGGAWDSPPAAHDWLSTVDDDGLPDMARERIADEFGAAEVSVWKDPRTCLTMPFWLPLMGDDPVVVLIHRHPVEVAGSLEARNKFGHGLSFALWERYNADALRFARDLPTSVIKYADVVSRPHEVMVELADQLRGWGVALPNDPATTDMESRRANATTSRPPTTSSTSRSPPSPSACSSRRSRRSTARTRAPAAQ